MIKEISKRLQQQLIDNKKNIISFAISTAIASVFYFGYHFFGNHFTSSVWNITGILLVILILIIMMMAGFVVMKSLFFVAAELSLLIFLAQSYCSVTGRSASGDNALKSLLIVGFAYVIVNAGRSLLKTLNEKYQLVKKDRLSKEQIFVVALFLIFISIFISQVYSVVNPIIVGLCVYK